jgi:Right handed beta helix region
MTRIAFLLTLIVIALASMPARAQQRVFVSGLGLDTNPCTVTQPCRTFQHAHDTAAVNGEIDVLDPAGYGPLTITHGISIQGHGYSSIFQTSNPGAAITVSVTTSDPVTLNGLLLDGGGTGSTGILITSGPSVQILNSVLRHFVYGIRDSPSTNGNLLVENTIASDNSETGIALGPNGGSIHATFNRITANNNSFGVATGANNLTIANSVISNNSMHGLDCLGGVTWIAKTVISGNAMGVFVGATVNSYGDNYLNDNTIPVGNGSLTPVTTQ